MQPDIAIAITEEDRRKVKQDADAIIRANPERRTKTIIRYRGTRPAWNWLAKKDRVGAAALWLAARRLLPEAANDNAMPEDEWDVDRREDEKPRGPNVQPPSLDDYLNLPSVLPRFGDARRQAVDYWWRERQGADEEPSRFAIKPQRSVFDFHPECRFGYCAPAIAKGAFFIGAGSGLGQVKPGKQRGDIRRVDEPDLPDMPDRILATVEMMLSGATLAKIGESLGARGRYADRKGGRAMIDAGDWAKEVIDVATAEVARLIPAPGNDNVRHPAAPQGVTNRAT